MMKLNKAIGKRIGIIGPNRNVTNVTFKIVEYFQWIAKVGPEYRSLKPRIVFCLVLVKSLGMIFI